MGYDYKLERLLETILDMPRELYMEIYYALSLEEKNYFKELFLNKTCMNCTNSSCRIEYNEKSNEITTCVGWENPELIGKQRVFIKDKMEIF